MLSGQKSRKSQPKKLFLTQDETKQLFKVIKNQRDLVIFKTAYRYGLRASEPGLLQRDTDVDLKRGTIVIQRLKGSSGGVYPIQADLLKQLRSYLRKRKDNSPYLFPSNRLLPIDRTTLAKLMIYYGTLAGLPRAKQFFHILKHSIGTHMAEAGADPFLIQHWLGLSNIQNAKVYTELTSRAIDPRVRTVLASPLVV